MALALAFGAGAAITSCVDTDSSLVDFGSQLNSPNDTVYSLLGIMNKMQVVADRTIILGEMMGELSSATETATTDLKELASFTATADNRYNAPEDYYAVIQNCNYYIAHADTALSLRGEKVFIREYAAVKAFRAWTYLQLAIYYGRVPFFTEPLMTEAEADPSRYPFYDVKQICEYFIPDLAPYVETDYPLTGNHSNIFIPVRALLGDLCLWAGRYREAAQYYHDYLTNFDNLVLASSIFLFYAGMEMMGIHVMDVKNPSRNYPKAIVIGSLVTVLIFVLGTFSLGFIIPAKDINLTQSLLIGFDNYFHYLRISWASPIIAVALMFGVLAGVLTWVSGPSKGIFAVGRAGYLPPFFQKSNKNGVQRNILLIQGGVVTLLALLFVVMPSVQSFYQILSQLTVLLYLIMYMLMFSAAIVLRYKMKGTARPFRLGKKGNGLMWTIGTVGFCGALLAFILSFVPPSQISVGSNTVWFSVLIIGCVVVVGAPFVIYAMRKPSWKDPQAAAEFAPFHWEVKAAPETQNIPQNNPQNTGNTAPENKQ